MSRSGIGFGGRRRYGVEDFLRSARSSTARAEETITSLVERNGIVAPTGEPGGLLMFHANLVHDSSANITPYPRRIVYLTLCAVSNAIRNPTRPEFIAHRDFTAVIPGAPDALQKYARARTLAA